MFLARPLILRRLYAYTAARSCKRTVSFSCFHPSIRDFAEEAARNHPVFAIPPKAIRVLGQPSHFYKTLLNMIERAEKRIFLSSLYIGGEESELISAIERTLKSRPHLQLTILLDLNRSTRPGPDSTARILLPMLQEFPSQVRVFMFRSPNLRGILSKIVPPRFNEGWGTWHAKVYGADDNVMISGANLNKSYFTDRQDRYLHFSSQKSLAEYCFDFIETAARFSYRLLPRTTKPESSQPHPIEAHTYDHDTYTLHWPIEDMHPHKFHPLAEKLFSQLKSTYREKMKTHSNIETGNQRSQNVMLVPIIQAGQFNIRDEETIFRELFKHIQSSKRQLMDLTSGYFSLYKPYQDLILNCQNVDCRIVAASPKSNGFYGSKGISGRIPEGYTFYEQRFMSAVIKAGRLWKNTSDGEGHGIILNEWEKPGWTYHAKGIWLSPDSSSPPMLTLFGSTNLNARSAHIDTELSLLMILPSGGSELSASEGGSDAVPQSNALPLRQELAREIRDIRSNSGNWKGQDRKVRWTTKCILKMLKGML